MINWQYHKYAIYKTDTNRILRSLKHEIISNKDQIFFYDNFKLTYFRTGVLKGRKKSKALENSANILHDVISPQCTFGISIVNYQRLRYSYSCNWRLTTSLFLWIVFKRKYTFVVSLKFNCRRMIFCEEVEIQSNGFTSLSW